MTRPALSASPAAQDRYGALLPALTAGSIGCVVLITLASPGATRMFTWPWTLIYAGALVLPALVLVFRAFDQHRPIVLPTRAWLVVALAGTATVLGSALFSPHRGSSLLWSAPLLAGLATFFVAFDWLNAETDRIAIRREQVSEGLVALSALIGSASMGLWLAQLTGLAPGELFSARNPFPLGHSNYTAGLALLMIPPAAAMAFRRRGRWQIAGIAAVMLALAMLFTSGSRGGFLGLVALALTALIASPLDRRRKWQLAVAAAIAGVAFAFAHPRIRAMFQRADPAAAPNLSNVQRHAMLMAGWQMGADRPLLGWGPGTTPLVFPRYRGGLDGGAENVLQLHCLPVQVWAEIGAAGVGCLLALAALVTVAVPRDPVAATTLAAYAVFSLTDWQLDVPIFADVVAVLAAMLAPAAASSNPIGYSTSRWAGRVVGGFTLICIGVVAFLGRRDPAPELNVRALAAAREPKGADRAVAMFRESLALNPHQEIAHFNLGWLLVVRDPAAAARHFAAAARLVPDKGGVYFGLGLARLNQGRREIAVKAFALECINDPHFLDSPWWREPAIAAERDSTAAEFGRRLAHARPLLRDGTWAAAQLARLAATPPVPTQIPPGAERSYRRERTGYPVLMRNLDLPTPIDLFDVREFENSGANRRTLPPKGWLPSPVLLALLNDTEPANN